MNKNEFPIMAYLGVHNCPNSIDNYKDFAECGFNLSMWRFKNLDGDNLSSLRKACYLAYKNNVGIIACTEEMYANPKNFAEDIKDLRGFAGYYIVDEPTKEQIPIFTKITEEIKSVDYKHIIYSNLHPYSCKEVLKKLGVKTYDEYLEEFAKLNVTHNSFDYYPIKKSKLTGKPYVDKKTWYKNLNIVKEYSEKQGKDFWAFILSTPHSRYPQPTIEHMRIQVFTNLAYGAQGIEYFTYQTPVNDPDYDFHDGPIEKDYVTKTKTWDVTKQMNTEIKNLSYIFHHGRNFKVVHSKCGIFFKYINELPDNIKQIHSTGNVLMSTFENGGHKYMMLVNKSFRKDVTVKIRLNGGCSVNCVYGNCIGAGEFFLSKGNCLIFEL